MNKEGDEQTSDQDPGMLQKIKQRIATLVPVSKRAGAAVHHKHREYGKQ